MAPPLGNIPWNKGKTNSYSEVTLEKMRNAKLGRRIPIEQRAKMGRKKELNHSWKGGVIHRQNGYTSILNPTHPFACKGYVYEHRMVIEKTLGRFLESHEMVHHKNGIKNDNRIENLELVSSVKEHSRIHHEIWKSRVKNNLICSNCKKGFHVPMCHISRYTRCPECR